jgi:hypothetical protein
MKINTFTVEGFIQFPTDMLRYDACWPMDQDSVNEMIESFDAEVRNNRRKSFKPFRLKLNTVGHITTERWSSFGWRVCK